MPQKPHHQSVAKQIRGFAKEMRRIPTDAEAAMWQLLRHRGLAEFKFRRQVPFQTYILDFVCFDKKQLSRWMEVSMHPTSAISGVMQH